MVDVETRRVIDFEIVQMANAPGRGNLQGSSNGMEVDATRQTVKRWEADANVLVAARDQNSKMMKMVHESRWNVRPEHEANHVKKALGRYSQEFPKEEW
jgi:hypothetical protein